VVGQVQSKSTRGKLGRFCGALVLLLCATILNGCVVVFTNALPNSQALKRDDRLLGKWEGKDEQGNRNSVQFESAPKNETNVSLSGDLGYRNPVFRMVTTRIAGLDYMILHLNDLSDDTGYILAKYATQDDKLTICLLNVDKVKEAIKKGKLKGEVGHTAWGGVTITNSSKGVLTFLKSPNSKDLFTCLGELKKVPAK
jgi:hypothetical protein